MVQILGKIGPIYVPYFAHDVFTLPAFRLTCRFQFTLPHRSDRQNVPVSLYSFEFQFTLLCRSDYKISTKNHTFAWLFFLPCITILAHKRAFFNRNFLYYNKKQNQSCEQDCKRCNYRHIDRESFCND